ncbi:acetylornithine transaminase [Micrococcus lylae]|uniref:acetylornithine transaminase n=1 Tax=Micrococcus lylae TaxID=1273 RepID=UPI000C7FD7ED|nr:acetylornithine transaminase [Micrococcus lylae]WIK83138.1 acetylornithine transaminase [Micrococcus lylae]
MTADAAHGTLLDRYGHAVTGLFGPPQRALVSGSGVRVVDEDGREYVDLLAGIAVNSLGHAHPRLVAAVSEQAGRLMHVSNLFTSEPQVGLAEDLLRLSGAPAGSSVFFANSGSEANEAAFKLARRHGGEDPSGLRTRVIALEGAFHGRTMGALALTSKEAYRAPFEPLPGGVERIPGGDLDALQAALAPDTEGRTVAAVLLEPVQGEGGVHGWPAGYLAGVRAATREAGALMILDEVQSGIGRTGSWFAFQDPAVTGADPVVPDAFTLAKGLGGGVPIGALVSVGPEVSALLRPGQHGTTFGGNPLAAAAARAVLATIEEEALLENVRRVGAALGDGLRAVDSVTEVRQYGLWLGVDLAADAVRPLPDAGPAPAVVRAALEGGWIVNATGPRTLRLAPPLILDEADARDFVAALPTILSAAGQPTENRGASL